MCCRAHSISGTACPNFTKSHMRVACDLIWRRCNVLPVSQMTSCFLGAPLRGVTLRQQLGRNAAYGLTPRYTWYRLRSVLETRTAPKLYASFYSFVMTYEANVSRRRRLLLLLLLVDISRATTAAVRVRWRHEEPSRPGFYSSHRLRRNHRRRRLGNSRLQRMSGGGGGGGASLPYLLIISCNQRRLVVITASHTAHCAYRHADLISSPTLRTARIFRMSDLRCRSSCVSSTQVSDCDSDAANSRRGGGIVFFSRVCLSAFSNATTFESLGV